MYFLIGWQTWGVLQPNIWKPLTQTVAPNWSARFAHIYFSQRSCIVFAQKQHTCIGKLFLTLKILANQIDNGRLLQTSNLWRQKLSCLHSIRTRFFLTCTRLDATDGIFKPGFVPIELKPLGGSMPNWCRFGDCIRHSVLSGLKGNSCTHNLCRL